MEEDNALMVMGNVAGSLYSIQKSKVYMHGWRFERADIGSLGQESLGG